MLYLRSYFQDGLGFSKIGTVMRCKVSGRLAVLGKCRNYGDLVEFCGAKESSNIFKAGCEEFSLLKRFDWDGSSLKFLPIGGIIGKSNYLNSQSKSSSCFSNGFSPLSLCTILGLKLLRLTVTVSVLQGNIFFQYFFLVEDSCISSCP